MSRNINEPAAPRLFATLLASRPQRVRRVTFADALVAAIIHICAIAVLVSATRDARMPGFAEEPNINNLILSDDVWLPLRLPSTPDKRAERARRSDRRARNTSPLAAMATAPQLFMPELDHVVPSLDERIASMAFEVASNEVNRAIDRLGHAIGRDSVDREPTFEEVRTGVRYTPYSAAPELLNRGEIAQRLERRYPRNLSQQGVGGRTMLWLLIDKDGSARKAVVQSSSGRIVFDALAIEMVPYMRFRPARNNGAAALVWVQLPVTFQVVDVEYR